MNQQLSNMLTLRLKPIDRDSLKLVGLLFDKILRCSVNKILSIIEWFYVAVS